MGDRSFGGDVYSSTPISPAVTSRAKRVLDIVVAIAALIVFLPVLLLVAVLVRLESPGPVIFRQKRGGLGGATFEIYKFRTMRVAEEGAEVRHATRADPRLTVCGGFLRRSSFDELPQLINVLKGEMSIVGPRPHALAHDALYSTLISGYRARMSVKPGLTGLAQVSGFRGGINNVQDMADRVACDLEYIEKWSILFDLRLLWLTLLRLPFDETAY